MSIKIDLEFETRLDSELLSVGISTRLIRLIASLRLKTREGWSDPYNAIIDTGSPITLIPKHIWDKVSIKWISPGSIQLTGLGSGAVSGKLAEVVIVKFAFGQIRNPKSKIRNTIGSLFQVHSPYNHPAPEHGPSLISLWILQHHLQGEFSSDTCSLNCLEIGGAQPVMEKGPYTRNVRAKNRCPVFIIFPSFMLLSHP